MNEKNQQFPCLETSRVFDTPEEARASEVRFRELQAECDTGRVPELRPRDVIYVQTELYMSHGCDDFQGGLAEVCEVRKDKSAGKLVPYIRVVQHDYHAVIKLITLRSNSSGCSR